MFKERLNGLYPEQIAPKVHRLLSAKASQGAVPAVFDIGTGSGSWVVDMAKLFPNAEVTGMDLVPANLSLLMNRGISVLYLADYSSSKL